MSASVCGSRAVRFHRQREMFGQIVSGDAAQGEMALYEAGTDVMCKLVAWFAAGGTRGNAALRHAACAHRGTLPCCGAE